MSIPTTESSTTGYFLKMNNAIALQNPNYLDTLLQYYEEEIAGEACFYGLADHFRQREKSVLLARVERVAAEAVSPLLKRHGLVPRDEKILRKEGLNDVAQYANWSWIRFMNYIVDRYPGYIDEFEALEAMAPDADLEALEKLTWHEIVVINFAQRELAGDPRSTEVLLSYIDSA